MSIHGKVLVVDDQEGIRRLLGETCAILGYEAVTVSTGNEAVRMAANTQFSAALIDMKMPGLSGLETIKRLREIAPLLKIVLMTGYGEIYQAEDIARLGVCGIIRKPFDLEEIKNFLEGMNSA
ncbi:MAG: response regulator [Peptococcaceae bacterium]|jgi:two-component system response regulator (stage 0 sporulation protein F)|nr:response regulator [Peptococcaceae bacterium]MDH7523739.1 response regulator [Peptococcaceae bacterium]